jgi:WD40 repeat protein/serine/threonine protein kinase
MSTTQDLLPREPNPRAEAAYLEFLKARDSGAGVTFSELCQNRPELADDLRLLHDTFEWAEAACSAPAEGDPGLPETDGAHYTVQREIGRGGMGIVFEVWDAELRRKLAMKVSRTGAPEADAPTPLKRSHYRFLEEAQVTAQLDHPGVVPIHELGLDREGHAYFTMRQVEGRTLQEVFDEIAGPGESGPERWGRTRALGVLVQVCDTLAFAHSRGVVHRDLKPANVMVGSFGEVYVMDWGLAKVLEPAAEGPSSSAGPRRTDAAWLAGVRTSRSEAAGETPGSPLATLEGSVLGTPGYMAPEQARGQLADVGTAGDVYAVGALLYQLLTSAMPYSSESRDQGSDVLELVRRGPPRPLHQLARDVPPELAAVCERAMAREPGARYADMELLAADLRAFLENRVVSAHRTGPLVELRKWMARNRALAAAVGTVLAVLVAAFALQIKKNRQLERASRATEFENYVAGVSVAGRKIDLGDVAAARADLEACPEELRGWEWMRQWQRLDDSSRTLWRGQVDELAVHPSEPWLAVAAWDGTTYVIDHRTGELVTQLDSGCTHTTAVDFSPDGRWLVTGCDSVRVWDTDGWVLIREHREPKGPWPYVSDLSFAPAGDRFATAHRDGFVRTWNLLSPEPTLAFRPHQTIAFSVSWSPDGRRLLSNAIDHVVWSDAADGSELVRFPARPNLVSKGVSHNAEAVVSPDGTRIALGQPDGGIVLWNVERAEVDTVLRGHLAAPRSLAFLDDDTLVSGSLDRTVGVWDLKSRERIRTLRGPIRGITDLVLHPLGHSVFTGSADQLLLEFELDSAGRGGYAIETDAEYLGGVSLSPDGTRLATGGKRVSTWEAGTGKLLRELEPVQSAHVAFGPDGVLYRTDRANTIFVLDPETGAELDRFGDPAARPVLWISADPGGRWLATAEYTLGLWDLTTRRLLATRPGRSKPAFDPSGDRLAFDRGDGDVAIARTPTLETELVLPGNGTQVWATAFDPEGRLLAGARPDGSVPIWDTRTGALVKVLEGHEGNVFSVAFSPDGTRLASASQDHTIKLWDPVRGAEVLTLFGHRAMVDRIVYSPDGSTIYSSSTDGSLRAWHIDYGLDELRQARPVAADIAALTLDLRRARGLLAQRELPGGVLEAAHDLLRLELPSATEFNRSTWDLVELPGAPLHSVEATLERMREACALYPLSQLYPNTLGVALVRLGRYEEALSELERADRLNQRSSWRVSRATDLLYQSLCHHRLGDAKRAGELLEQARAEGGEGTDAWNQVAPEVNGSIGSREH